MHRLTGRQTNKMPKHFLTLLESVNKWINKTRYTVPQKTGACIKNRETEEINGIKIGISYCKQEKLK